MGKQSKESPCFFILKTSDDLLMTFLMWFMGSQRAGHDWVTDIIWSDSLLITLQFYYFIKYFQQLYLLPQQPEVYTSVYHCSVQFSSVAQSCLTPCDPMNCSMPGLPVHHLLPKFTQTHIHLVGDAIQPSHPLLSPSPSAPNPSQHQDLFQWVSSSHQVAKVLEFQL